MKLFTIAALPFCLLLAAQYTQAQAPMLSNQGALISVKDAAFVSVHGNVLNERAGQFHNSDTIHVFGDWENNAGNEAFISNGEGVLTLRGATQNIKGSSITRFYDLRLENTGVKYGRGIDVYVDGFLRLNDREMNMDTNVVHVFNTDINAILTGMLGNFGFVSATENGGLLRHTANSLPYSFPLGSTLGVTRFRPLHIRPENSSANAFRARLANIDASNEGYDRTQKDFEICNINPNFYHRIARTVGAAAAGLDFFYDAAADGNYTNIGHWDALAWRDATSATAASASQYGLDRLSADSLLSVFTPFPFALVNVSPPVTLAAAQNPICSHDTLQLEAQGNYTTFDFFVDSTWMQNSASTSYQTQLTAGLHPVWVVGSNGVCGRTSDTIWVQTFQSPTALASPDTIIVTGTAAHLYAAGGDFYEWTPAANLSCNVCAQTAANPLQTTTYTLTVETIDGCTDSDTVHVEVKSAVEQVLIIPNVITPNDDGKNDTWRIENIQLFPSNKVIIVNRWGDVVFQSEFYNNDWDGTFSGGLLPAGTYYYVLNLGAGWGVFKGPVTIIRK